MNKTEIKVIFGDTNRHPFHDAFIAILHKTNKRMMKLSTTVVRATLSFLLVFMSLVFVTAQTTITGTVVNQETDAPIEGAVIHLMNQSAVTDAFGVFEMKATAAGPNSIQIESVGFQTLDVAVDMTKTTIDLGVLKMAYADDNQELTDELIPTITLSNDDLDGDDGGAKNISGVLSASRDVFQSAAAFTFGASARFRIRGYDAQYTNIFLNGTPINNMENGRVAFSHFGGLNDVMRNRTGTIGLAASTFDFGGIGGSSNIDTRARNHRKQVRVSYALANRGYTNRLMATYGTGMMPSGWAVSLAASRRWAEEGYVDGTFYDAYSYFLSVDRKLTDKSILNLSVLGAPVKRGKLSGATQEAYDLAGSNFYNANWGYQEGEKRNARVRDEHQPMAILRHDWEINDKMNLATILSYQTGHTGNTALDWYNASDPRPNYYRYLPSFYDTDQADQIAQLWATDVNTRQIDWDELYQVNYNSFQTVEDANGIEGNTVSGLRSQYIVEDRRTDITRRNFNTILEIFPTDRLTIQTGVSYNSQTTENYKLVDDLLGGDFYMNVDRFAEFDSTGAFTLNNIEIPNQILEEGDRWGYDYNWEIRKARAWTQFNFSFPKVDFFVAGEVGQVNFWRDGQVANGKFPEESKGESEKQDFSDWSAKGGVTYKINGRNYLLFNGLYQKRAPYVRDAFLSPRTRNQLVNNLQQETVKSIEGGYMMKAPNLKVRAIGYFSQFENQLFNRSLFLDRILRIGGSGGETLRGFVNYVMTDVNTQHAGVELAVETKITSALSFNAVAAIGQYIYTNRPTAEVYLDQLAEPLRSRTVYIDNYSVAGSPNEAYSAGFRYQGKKFWFVNIDFNFFPGAYLDFYPERRTIAAVAYSDDPQVIQDVVTPDSELWNSIIDQERLDEAFTVNLFAGKSWKLSNGHFVYLNLSVNNLLNNKDFRTGGYEQFRFDFEGKDTSRFPNNYFYSYGTNFFASITYKM